MDLTPPLLEQMLATGTAVTGSPLHSQISEVHARALQQCVRAFSPANALEVGMAYGVATLAILGGGASHLTSVDPKQADDYRDEGLKAVHEAGFADRHSLRRLPSYVALPGLLAEGARLQFAYIDGWHTFDHVLLDFFYIDKMLDAGGVVGFNDCFMPAVHRVIRFACSHRQYVELDVGLGKNYAGRSKLDTLKRRFSGRRHDDRYFKKVTDEDPEWNFYAPF
jgi:predicted O-methyltransferase YrrM